MKVFCRQQIHCLLFVCLTLINSVKACADIIFLINLSRNPSVNEQLKDSIVNVAQHLELDSGLHKASLVTNTSITKISYDEFKSNEQFLDAVEELKYVNYNNNGTFRLPTGSTLDEDLESIALRALNKRRKNHSLVILLFDDGTSAFAASAYSQERFTNFIKKHQYISFYIVSRKAERLRNSLKISKANVCLVNNSNSEINVLIPFLKCFGNVGDFRRSPNVAPVTLILNENLDQLRLQQRVVANNLNSNFSIRQRRLLKQQLKKKQVSLNKLTTIETKNLKLSTQKPFTGRPGCQFDIVFLIDSSGGVNNKRQRYLELATELVQVLKVGEFDAQIGLVRYSGCGRAYSVFKLKTYQNKMDVIREILNTPLSGGTTRTAEALLYAQNEFSKKFGGRGPKAQKFLVLFTDGYSQDDSTHAANQLKRNQIHIYTVAVDDITLPPNNNQLRAIASDQKSALLDSQFNVLKKRFIDYRCH